MTALTDKIEALAKDATPGPWDFSAKVGWIFSRPDPLTTYVIADIQSSNDTNAALIVELVNNLPTILEWKRERDQAVEALREAERAIAEYYRYWTGGETRGSYDGKPERNGLWRAQHKAHQTLASIEGAGHE